MKQVFITHAWGQTRAALIDQDWICDFFLETKQHTSLKDHVYIGRVTDHVKSLNRALVDIGLEQLGFIDVKNPKFLPGVGKKVLVQALSHGAGLDPEGHALLKLTTNISFSLPGLVHMPNREDVMISTRAKTSAASENADWVNVLADEGFRGIIRSQGLGGGLKNLQTQWTHLKSVWERVQKGCSVLDEPTCLYAPSTLLRWLDLVGPVDEIITDDSTIMHDIRTWQRLWGDLCPVERASEAGFPEPIEEAWQDLYENRVPLSHGASLEIHNAGPATLIDVNSGSGFTAHDAEQTFLKVNLEAVPEALRQIRLRNLKGMILVDFITMKTPHHRKMLEQKLKSMVKSDPHGLIFHGLTHLGLAELTRESHFPQLTRLLMNTEVSKTPEALCYELLQAALRHKGSKLTIELGPTPHTTLHETFRDELAHLKSLFADLTLTKVPALGMSYQLVDR
jgi:Rne/Rng family ribonuclease